MIQDIRKELFSLADEKYKEFHGGLCPGVNNIIGVRVPALRSLAKKIIKEDWRKYLKEAEDQYYEEVMLQGMVIGLAKMDIEERLTYLAGFIPKIDNWAVCDVTCAGLKSTAKNLKKVWEFLQKYLNSDKEFEVRFAVVIILDYYIQEEYIYRVFEKLDSVHHEAYYVKMAVAWAVSICYIKYPEKTYSYLESCKLDNFTFNKAIQKIRESYRVPKEDKENLKKMLK